MASRSARPSIVALVARVALAVTWLATESLAADAPEAPTGVLLKGELSLATGLGLAVTSFSDVSAAGTTDYSFVSPFWPAGLVLGLNLGFAPSARLRWGLRGSLQGGGVPVDGGGIPWTGLTGYARYTVGPTLGLRFGAERPFELEFGLGFASQVMLGGQAEIGSPDNRYPLGAAQYGVDLLGRILWRPGGPRSRVAWQVGLDAGWAMTDARGTLTDGYLFVPEFGLVVGL